MTDKPSPVQEKLNQLKAEYAAKLPAELEQLRADVQRLASSECASAFDSVYNRLHKLSGSAGSFGFNVLGQQARELEKRLKSWQVAGGASAERQVGTEQPARAEQLISAEQPISAEQLISAEQIVQLQKALAAFNTTPISLPPGSGKGWVGEAGAEQGNIVYLLEDDAALAAELQAALVSFGYCVEHFLCLEEAEKAIVATPPDFLLVDVVFDAEERLGPEMIASLQQQMATPLPVVFMSSRDDYEAYLAAVRAGAVGYFVKPLDVAQIIDCLETHLNSHQRSPYRVLIVDDDDMLAQHYKLVLEGAGIRVEVASDPRNVLQIMRDYQPETVLLDLNLPGCRGYELAQLIRLNPEWLRVAITYLSSEQDEQQQIFAVGRGGEDFLTKPISDVRLVSTVTTRAARTRQLSNAIDRDSLTGLLKHARIKDQVAIELTRAARRGEPVSVVMIDLDHFKRVNDTYGHAVGDRVIRALSQLLRQRLRKTDSVGRYGGEEFVAILVNCDECSAKQLLDEVRQDFQALHFIAKEQTFNVTLSAGIACSSTASAESNILEDADRALYSAKAGGRNRVCVSR